jgi:hypothetical protein
VIIGTNRRSVRSRTRLAKRPKPRLRVMALEEHIAPTSLYDSLQQNNNTYQTARAAAVDTFNAALDNSNGQYSQQLGTEANAREGAATAGAAAYDADLTAADRGMATAMDSATQDALNTHGQESQFDVSGSNDATDEMLNAAQGQANAMFTAAGAINSARNATDDGAASTYSGTKSSLDTTWDGVYASASSAFNTSATAAESAYTNAENAADQAFTTSAQAAVNAYRTTMQGADNTLNAAVQTFYMAMQQYMMQCQMSGHSPDPAYTQGLTNTLNQAKKNYALAAADANITYVTAGDAAFDTYVASADAAGLTKTSTVSSANVTYEGSLLTGDKAYGDGSVSAVDQFSDTAIGAASTSRVSLGNAVVAFNNNVNGLLGGNAGANLDAVESQLQGATTAWASGYFGDWSTYNQTIQSADKTNIQDAWTSLNTFLAQWSSAGTAKGNTVAGAQRAKTQAAAQLVSDFDRLQAANQEAAADAQAQSVKSNYQGQPIDFFATLQPGSYSNMPLTPVWMPGVDRLQYQGILQSALYQSNGYLSQNGWTGQLDLCIITIDMPLINNTIKRGYQQFAPQMRQLYRQYHLTDSFLTDARDITLIPWQGPANVPGANPSPTAVLTGFLNQLPKAFLDTYPSDLTPLKQQAGNVFQSALSGQNWRDAFGDAGPYVRWPVGVLGVASLLGADYVLPNHPILNLGNNLLKSSITIPADPSDPTALTKKYDFSVQMNLGKTADYLLGTMQPGFQYRPTDLYGQLPIFKAGFAETWKSTQSGIPVSWNIALGLDPNGLFAPPPAPPSPGMPPPPKPSIFTFSFGLHW